MRKCFPHPLGMPAAGCDPPLNGHQGLCASFVQSAFFASGSRTRGCLIISQVLPVELSQILSLLSALFIRQDTVFSSTSGNRERLLRHSDGGIAVGIFSPGPQIRIDGRSVVFRRAVGFQDRRAARSTNPHNRLRLPLGDPYAVRERCSYVFCRTSAAAVPCLSYRS